MIHPFATEWNYNFEGNFHPAESRDVTQGFLDMDGALVLRQQLRWLSII